MKLLLFLLSLKSRRKQAGEFLKVVFSRSRSDLLRFTVSPPAGRSRTKGAVWTRLEDGRPLETSPLRRWSPRETDPTETQQLNATRQTRGVVLG